MNHWVIRICCALKLSCLLWLTALGAPVAFSQKYADGHSYYISPAGNDQGPGTAIQPWKTLAKVSRTKMYPGDSILLQGCQTFQGPLSLNMRQAGKSGSPVTISTFGIKWARVRTDSGPALMISHSHHISISRLSFQGSGRNKGNAADGIQLLSCRDLVLDSVDVSGFQKAGLLIFCSFRVMASHVLAHDLSLIHI